MQWVLVIGLLFAIAVAIFATVNVTEVPINYVFGEARWPLVLVIFGSVFAGVIISLCFSLFRIFSSRQQVKSIQKELDVACSIINEKKNEIVRLKKDLNKQAEISSGNEAAGDHQMDASIK
ncbi:LapA family protein [Solibacillus sp. FSL K6-1523]|uniref:LapA family protein n=1 Tax=Solibacillus sp. FSL K6-1523 TaxID=2921471 RepID=UPI0030FC02C6